MATNYERYFGSPEKAAQMRIEHIEYEEEMLDGVVVLRNGMELSTFWGQQGESFLEWLQQEIDD